MGPGAAVRGGRGKESGHIPACIVDQDSRRAWLASGHIPGVLIPGGGVAVAIPGAGPAARAIPVAAGELQLQLVVASATELLDGDALQAVEVGFAVIERAQDGEWQGEDDPVEVLDHGLTADGKSDA